MITIEVFQNLHDTFLQDLNPEIFSSDSFRSLAFLILGFGVMFFCMRTFKRAIQWWIGLILFVEIMYFIAFGTQVGVNFPFLQNIFKYDVFQMMAQLCVGTKVCDVILYIRAFLQGTITVCVTVIWNFVKWLWYWITTQTILPKLFKL